MLTRDALAIAEEQELDLVEVAPNAEPPVCRLLDYGKYLYEKQKRERESRKAQKQIEVKEVRLRPKTDEHDIQVVLTKIRKFAKEGAKIRADSFPRTGNLSPRGGPRTPRPCCQ
jgi:translation initiation factor IF-3